MSITKFIVFVCLINNIKPVLQCLHDRGKPVAGKDKDLSEQFLQWWSQEIGRNKKGVVGECMVDTVATPIMANLDRCEDYAFLRWRQIKIFGCERGALYVQWKGTCRGAL